jgi:hypothetical protein
MYAHGVNLGHGFVKYVIISDHGEELSPIIFPAIIAPASATVTGAIQQASTVQVGERCYWVGEDAVLSDTPISNLSQQRLTDPVFIPTLLQHVFHNLPPDGGYTGICVTGLPATWAQDIEKAQALGARLRSATGCYTTIKVIPEPLGMLYSMLLDKDGQTTGDPMLIAGQIGIVDLGHLTVDVCAVNQARPIAASLETYQLGSAQPLKQIRAHLSAHFERELSLHAVDQAIRQDALMIAGRQRALPAGWDRPIFEAGEAIAARLTEAWGSGNQFDAVLIGGGGAELAQLVAPLQQRFPHAQIVPDPQIAVARGYARLARRLVQQEVTA